MMVMVWYGTVWYGTPYGGMVPYSSPGERLACVCPLFKRIPFVLVAAPTHTRQPPKSGGGSVATLIHCCFPC